jgi:hypothetical protein
LISVSKASAAKLSNSEVNSMVLVAVYLATPACRTFTERFAETDVPGVTVVNVLVSTAALISFCSWVTVLDVLYKVVITGEGKKPYSQPIHYQYLITR